MASTHTAGNLSWEPMGKVYKCDWPQPEPGGDLRADRPTQLWRLHSPFLWPRGVVSSPHPSLGPCPALPDDPVLPGNTFPGTWSATSQWQISAQQRCAPPQASSPFAAWWWLTTDLWCGRSAWAWHTTFPKTQQRYAQVHHFWTGKRPACSLHPKPEKREEFWERRAVIYSWDTVPHSPCSWPCPIASNPLPYSFHLYSSELPWWHNFPQPTAYLLTWCSCRYLAFKFIFFSSTEKLHESFPSLPALLRTLMGSAILRPSCKAFFKRMFR